MADLLNHEFWTPLKPGANVSRAKREPTQRPMSRSPCGQSTWRRVKVNVIWYGWCWCRHQGHETRWWQLKCFWNFHPETWGRFPIWRAYFSKGLVQPPTRWNQGMIIPVFVVRKETKSWNLPLKKHDFRTWFCYRFWANPDFNGWFECIFPQWGAVFTSHILVWGGVGGWVNPRAGVSTLPGVSNSVLWGTSWCDLPGMVEFISFVAKWQMKLPKFQVGKLVFELPMKSSFFLGWKKMTVSRVF